MLPLTTQSLGTQRRLISLDPMGMGPEQADVVAAARNRLQAAQDAKKQALDFAARQAILKHAQKVQRQRMREVQQQVLTGPGSYVAARNMPMPKGQLGDWIREAIKLTPGTRMRLAPGIRNMIMHESGGNPRAINNWDSNAAAGTPSIGLMQTIQPTFNAHALKGHKNIYNPVDNIMAGLMYAISRYGHKMVRQGGRHDAYGNYIGY
jgi:hypothetical protein